MKRAADMNADHHKLTQANDELKRRLRMLVEQAWHNERTLKRFQNLELRLMGCDSFADLIRVLVYESRSSLDWDAVTLILHDPDFELRRLLQQSGIEAESEFSDVRFVDTTGEFTSLFDHRVLPQLGPYERHRHAAVFSRQSDRVNSVALLPLRQGHQFIGLLALGNQDRDRFRDTTATDFLQHMAAVIATCVEMTSVRDQLKYLGLTDPLTGINNRRFFDQRLQEELARCQRLDQPLGCLFVDVDHFKQFNDQYGHAGGDQVLQDVARVIRAQLRTQDVVARYGGEEFVVLLSHASREKTLEIAERIRAGIDEHETLIDGQSVSVSASVGVCVLAGRLAQAEQPDAAAALLSRADEALYVAKQAGRNRVEYLDPVADQGWS